MTTNQFTYDQLSFLQPVHTEILTAIARGQINIMQHVREELASRGMDLNDKWIGFEAARAIHLAGSARDLRPSGIK